MSDENLRALMREHIESIGIKNIKKMLKDVKGGPTNEEFFGKPTAELIREKVKQYSFFNKEREAFRNVDDGNKVIGKKIYKINFYNVNNKSFSDHNYDSSEYFHWKEVA